MSNSPHREETGVLKGGKGGKVVGWVVAGRWMRILGEENWEA